MFQAAGGEGHNFCKLLLLYKCSCEGCLMCFRSLAVKGICELLSLVPSQAVDDPAYEVHFCNVVYS